jgi:hypothetical protein
MIFTLGGALPLDEAGGTALFAFGLRKLRNGYTGSALQVRNSVGAIGNLAFDSNDEVSTLSNVNITTAGGSFTSGSNHTLAAFANSADVTVRTWYDQSGRGRDIIQATVANQPFLMQGGFFRLVDGKPSVYFPYSLRRLNYVGNCADYYNLINNLGSTTIVKYASTSAQIGTNQISIWGITNFTTDSSSVSASNCGSNQAFYAFGIPNGLTGTTGPIGFASRTIPNVVETCDGVTYPTCASHPIIGIGTSISNTIAHNGAGGRIYSFADSNAARNLKTYINGTLDFTRGYLCDLTRFPLINVSASSTFFIGNTVTPNPSVGTGGGTDIDYSFQEFIAYDGTNYHFERNLIERNMGRYYNITVS